MHLKASAAAFAPLPGRGGDGRAKELTGGLGSVQLTVWKQQGWASESFESEGPASAKALRPGGRRKRASQGGEQWGGQEGRAAGSQA